VNRKVFLVLQVKGTWKSVSWYYLRACDKSVLDQLLARALMYSHFQPGIKKKARECFWWLTFARSPEVSMYV